jgi:hypothetical protein
MSGANITSLHGGPTGTLAPNEDAIIALEEALDAARSGHVVGVGIVCLHHDGMSSTSMGGTIGSYGLIGAAYLLARDIAEGFA